MSGNQAMLYSRVDTLSLSGKIGLDAHIAPRRSD